VGWLERQKGEGREEGEVGGYRSDPIMASGRNQKLLLVEGVAPNP
jgi:hypothetical protein